LDFLVLGFWVLGFFGAWTLGAWISGMADMIYSEIQKYGVAVTAEHQRADGSGWQRYYKAPDDYDMCSNCTREWGHLGSCIAADVVLKKPRVSKVAAATNLASRIVKSKRRNSDKKQTDAASLLMRLGADHIYVSPPPSPLNNVAVDGHGFLPTLPPPSPVATFPSMREFLEDCDLVSYIDAMLEDGFDNVKVLSTYEREEDKDFKNIIDAGVFPIVKIGHIMKLVSKLRKIELP
jgi:hypothetical protein